MDAQEHKSFSLQSRTTHSVSILCNKNMKKEKRNIFDRCTMCENINHSGKVSHVDARHRDHNRGLQCDRRLIRGIPLAGILVGKRSWKQRRDASGSISRARERFFRRDNGKIRARGSRGLEV